MQIHVIVTRGTLRLGRVLALARERTRPVTQDRPLRGSLTWSGRARLPKSHLLWSKIGSIYWHVRIYILVNMKRMTFWWQQLPIKAFSIPYKGPPTYRPPKIFLLLPPPLLFQFQPLSCSDTITAGSESRCQTKKRKWHQVQGKEKGKEGKEGEEKSQRNQRRKRRRNLQKGWNKIRRCHYH